MSSTQTAQSDAWERLQERISGLSASQHELQEKLERLRGQVRQISIYRPLNAYLKLSRIGAELGKLGPQYDDIVRGYESSVAELPHRTTGETLSSCFDCQMLAFQLARVQSIWNEIDTARQQTGAFSFSIFSLYVAVLSLLGTLVFGVWSCMP